MATPKREQNLSLEEIEQALLGNEAERQRLRELKKRKKKEEYSDLCRMIAEFTLDLTDLDAQPVVDFRKRMEEKNYEAAAKILIFELTGAANNAPARALRKDRERDQKKGKNPEENTEVETEVKAEAETEVSTEKTEVETEMDPETSTEKTEVGA